ncbi:hypothetical protein M3Y97_00810700 [Aphelenchoides bicaudatus]|nr:hypothetical protein M3Y97_00810700 [Aphelenchoides bicaudatus]
MDHAEFEYTRDEVLSLRAKYVNAQLPSHLFHQDYLTSHGKFSPDKYVECLWKNERTQKSVNRVIRSENESLHNGSSLAPQRRNFQGGCKEAVGSTSSATTKNAKNDKRTLGTTSWSFNSRGFTTNGYKNDMRAGNRRDSERVEAIPEWMEDGPESSTELMQLCGFSEQEKQEKRLEKKFQKLGLPADVISRQKESKEEEKLVIPASDVEFAAQFGILDLADIEAKIFKDEIEEPKSSRLSRFFGSERSQESRQTPTLPPEPVLPAVARLLSFGSKSIGSLSDPAQTNSLTGLFNKQAQPTGTLPPVNTSTNLPEQITSVAPAHPYHSTRIAADPSDSTTAQKQNKNIDLVPTAVMLQRTTVKEQMDVRAPRFSNPNSPSPFHEQESGHSASHPTHHWQPDNFHNPHDSNLSNFNNMTNIPNNYIPAFCRLGSHVFPLPNPIALSADGKHINQAFENGDYKTASCIQTRMHAQMQVFAALHNFRNDPSFLVVPATDPQFEHLLEIFVEQQRQLDSSLSEKLEEELVECQNPPDGYNNRQNRNRFSPIVPSSSNTGGETNGSPNLSILKKIPAKAKMLTVEELEAQLLC